MRPASIGSGFLNTAKGSKNEVSGKLAQQCHKIEQVQSIGGRLQHSTSPVPNQVGNTRATCRSFVDKATASPADHKRMTGKYLLDVFGGRGFLPKVLNHLGLRGLCARHEVWSHV